MTSHLCKNHGDAFPARFLTTDVLPPSGDYAPRFVEVPGMVPNGWGPSPTGDLQVRYPAKPEPKIWSMGFYPRPLPDGTVHFHTFYQPDVVLKRKDGDVIAGVPDAHSAWRIEHLFEHADPPANGVWYVIRSPDTGMFLAARNGRLVLVGNPDSLDARWRFDFAVLPAEAGREFIELTVKEPPRLILDQGALNRLTDWAVKEYYRQEQPACWKKGGSGDCPSGQDTNCGLFCAKSTEMCVMDVTEMVVSVGELAANIAGVVFTAGTANVALKAARTAGAGAKLGMRQFMRTAGRAIKNKLHDRLGARVLRFVKSRGKSESFKKLARDVAKQTAIETGKLTAKEAMSSAADAYLEREQARHADNLADAYAREVSRMAAEKIALQAAAGDNPDWLAIAAMVDPTGVMAVVDAYYKPMCEETPMPDVTF